MVRASTRDNRIMACSYVLMYRLKKELHVFDVNAFANEKKNVSSRWNIPHSTGCSGSYTD